MVVRVTYETQPLSWKSAMEPAVHLQTRSTDTPMPADTSRTNLAVVLALLSRLSKPQPGSSRQNHHLRPLSHHTRVRVGITTVMHNAQEIPREQKSSRLIGVCV